MTSITHNLAYHDVHITQNIWSFVSENDNIKRDCVLLWYSCFNTYIERLSAPKPKQEKNTILP